MTVGADELGQHEAVDIGALAARRAEPEGALRSAGWLHRDHCQPGAQEPVDQQPIRTLDRDQDHLEREQPFATTV